METHPSIAEVWLSAALGCGGTNPGPLLLVPSQLCLPSLSGMPGEPRGCGLGVVLVYVRPLGLQVTENPPPIALSKMGETVGSWD